MTQLCFPFAAGDPQPAGPSRATTYWHRRIDRAIRRAYELGKRQYQRRAAAPCLRALDVAPLPMRSFCPTREERDELQAIAARVAKLTISRTNPHEFFETKSELAHELRQIARRA